MTHCVTDPVGCQTCMTDTIVIYPLPVVCFGDSAADCVPFDVTFMNCSDNGTYYWDFGAAGTSVLANPTVTFSDPGCYDVQLQVTSPQQCTSSVIQPCFIEGYPVPVADFIANPNEVSVLNPVITFTDKSSDGIHWIWNFGDSTLLDSTQHPTHIYSDTGCYVVNLWMENQYGCEDVTSGEVCVIEVPTLYVPNAFTPNGIEPNEIFMAKGNAIATFEMYIFDRWGNLIFESNDIYRGWNGKVQGSDTPAQEDVYVWLILARDIYGKEHKMRGHVTLIR